MSCDCRNHGPIHQSFPYHCDHVNRMFDPNPPAFYGTWNNTHRFSTTNRVSLTQPGVANGLFAKQGPLNCQCCGNVTSLIGVLTQSRTVLTLDFQYSNPNMNTRIDVEPGKIYTVEFTDNGQMFKVTGMVTDIYKVNQISDDYAIYKIKFDCSMNYSNNVVVVKTDQIRSLKEYYKYDAVDKNIKNAKHTFATNISDIINDAVIINAELDSGKNIISGTIIGGTIVNGKTVDGLVEGKNGNNENITMLNTITTGGTILNGKIVGGIIRSGDIDGIEGEDGITTNATVKGIISNAFISDISVEGAYTVDTTDAIVIDKVLENSQVINAIVSGSDMITTGGITIDNITTGGITIGGTAVGGIASGFINNNYYTITGGTTVSKNSTISNNNGISGSGGTNITYGTDSNGCDYKKVVGSNGNVVYVTTNSKIMDNQITVDNLYESDSNKLITRGGTVIGGTVIGGRKVGRVIYNAIVKGGTVKDGITENGMTYGGTFIPGVSKDVIEAIINSNTNYDRNKDKDLERLRKEQKERWFNKDDILLLSDNRPHKNHFYTNLGTVEL